MDNRKTAMSEIIGNADLKARLCRDIMDGSLSHAYIIEGPNGSGKKTVALMAAAALSCQKKADASLPLPCLTCPSCKKILEMKSPDVIVKDTDGKASIGVDMARFLKEDVHTLPNDLEHKVYIIDDADKMTVQAQNALLLTLEEPPSFVHFFLLCESSELLLETIRSRAPTIRTQPVEDGLIDSYLCSHDRRAAQMKATSRDEYFQLIRSASGGIGRALELLEPKAWKPIKEIRTLISDIVSAAIYQKSKTRIFSLVFSLSTKRDELEDQLLLLLSAVRDLILLKKSDSPPLSFFCDKDMAIDLCDRAKLSFLFTLQASILTAIDENKRNANVRLLLTKMLQAADII